MARIPEEELRRLKEQVPIEDLVKKHGVELRRHGSDLLGLCPLHDDHEPSLVVSPKKDRMASMAIAVLTMNIMYSKAMGIKLGIMCRKMM